jgi:valyl-tRNA synthetase
MISPLPRKNDSLINLPAEEALEIIKEVVYHIRNIRGEMHIPPSQKIEAVLFSEDEKTTRLLKNYQNYLISLALLKNLTFSTSRKKPHSAATAIVKGVEILIPLEGLIDFGEEEKRLKKEISKVEKEMAFVQKKLTNEDFLSKAPREVVEKEKKTHQVLLGKKKKLDESIARFQEMRGAGQ